MEHRAAPHDPAGDVRRPGDHPTGELPVLLVHGIRTSSTMWRAQVAALERAGRRSLAVDLPGHGTRRGEAFTLEAVRETLDGAVDELGGQVLLVGLSLGGYLAIDYAARRPGRVHGLVAAGCCTSPQTPARAVWAEVARWIERTPDSGARLNAVMVERFLSDEGAQDIAAGGFALTVMSQALDALAPLDPVRDLARLGCPLWLVNGRLDHFRTQERRYLAAARSSGQVVHHVVVPRARHLVSLDAPVAFARVVQDALSELEASDGPGVPAREPGR